MTLLSNSVRCLDPAYAAAETLWYLSGQRNGRTLLDYAPSYSKFLDENGWAYGAYGWRTVNSKEGNMMSHIIEALRRDPDTRQAVVPIWHSHDTYLVGNDKPNVDMPCTLTWQFIRRRDVIHMIVNMRSNDLWLGFPYDVFAFTCVQQVIAGCLGCRVGTYTHNVGSMHLYAYDYEKAKSALAGSHRFLSHGWLDPCRSYASALTALDRVNSEGTLCEADMLRDLQLACLHRRHKVQSPSFTSPLFNYVETQSDNHRRSRQRRKDDSRQEA